MDSIQMRPTQDPAIAEEVYQMIQNLGVPPTIPDVVAMYTFWYIRLNGRVPLLPQATASACEMWISTARPDCQMQIALQVADFYKNMASR
jgi:hypothetical protein